MMEKPSLRDRLRPAELLGLSAAIGVFTGLVLLLTTQSLVLVAVGFGVTFILSVMTIALLALSAKPDELERRDLDEQNRPGH